MPGKKKQVAAPEFPVGSHVRVKAGTTDPDFPDMPLGGWTGKVEEVIQDAQGTAYLVAWDRYTLHNVHPAYRSLCAEEDLDPEKMCLGEEVLEPDPGEPACIEQPTALTSWPSTGTSPEDRVGAVFDVTGDERIPRVNLDSLRRFHAYLTAHLVLPCEGRLTDSIGPHQDTKSPLSIVRLMDPVKEYGPEEMYGLICKAVQKGKRIELPLGLIDVDRRNPNYLLLRDYGWWMQIYR